MVRRPPPPRSAHPTRASGRTLGIKHVFPCKQHCAPLATFSMRDTHPYMIDKATCKPSRPTVHPTAHTEQKRRVDTPLPDRAAQHNGGDSSTQKQAANKTSTLLSAYFSEDVDELKDDELARSQSCARPPGKAWMRLLGRRWWVDEGWSGFEHTRRVCVRDWHA